eukprot:6100192-Prymnesium_polylepis.2
MVQQGGRNEDSNRVSVEAYPGGEMIVVAQDVREIRVLLTAHVWQHDTSGRRARRRPLPVYGAPLAVRIRPRDVFVVLRNDQLNLWRGVGEEAVAVT